jgi:hypothetical protein
MTFAEAKTKNPTSPVVLFEFDLDEERDLFLYSEPGIPYLRLTKINATFGDWWEQDNYNETLKQIASLTVDDGVDITEYIKVTSKSSLRSQNESFLFDYGEQTIYIHFTDFDPWYLFKSIALGVIQGYSDVGYHSGTIYYPPRLITGGLSISAEKDPLFFGAQSFEQQTVKLRNDGQLDSLADENLYGHESRIKLGFRDVAYTDFKTIFTGRISNIPGIAFDEVSVEVQDLRAFYTRDIPTDRFTKADYPNINEDHVNKRIPIRFGRCRGVKCICLNEEESGATSFTFKVCDPLDYGGIKSVDAVYVDDSAKTPTATDLVNCTFTLSDSDVNGKHGSVTADIQGYEDGSSVLIENGLYVIRELIRYYLELEYIDAIFDTTQWDSEETGAANCNLDVSEKTELNDAINDISHSLNGIFTVTGEGKFTFKTTDNDRAIVATIPQRHVLNEPSQEMKKDLFLSSATCLYNQHFDSGNYRREMDDSLEEEIYQIYRQRKNKEFETLLVESADALAYAEEIMVLSKRIPRLFEVTVPIRYFDLEVLDNVDIYINRIRSMWLGIVKAEILATTINLDSFLIDLRIRYIDSREIETRVLKEVEMITDDAESMITDDGNTMVAIVEG